jgi:hypothetical protein
MDRVGATGDVGGWKSEDEGGGELAEGRMMVIPNEDTISGVSDPGYGVMARANCLFTAMRTPQSRVLYIVSLARLQSLYV